MSVASTSKDISHIPGIKVDAACQTDPPPQRSVRTQLSWRTLRTPSRSIAVQAQASHRNVGVGTKTVPLEAPLPDLPTDPIERPSKRSSVDSEEEDEDPFEGIPTMESDDSQDPTYDPTESIADDTETTDMLRVCDVQTTKMGTFISVQQLCPHCQFARHWNSQPILGSTPAGNLQLSAATYVNGVSFYKLGKPQHQRILSPRGFPPSVRTDIKRSHERGEAYRISTHCWTLFSPRARVSRSGMSAVGAAEEGGGLPSSSTGDNGLTVAVVGEQSATEPTAPGRFPSTTAVIEEPEFALRVLVRDLVTRQALPGASVDVYLNHTLRSSVRTGRGGSPGLSLTLLGNMEGYVPSPLPWSSTKRPIFSAVTLLLLPHSQGNIWLYQDSVLITGKLPDSSFQPKVQFPKSLLTKSDNSNISSVTAYLTVPQHHLAKDCANCTPGLISQKSLLRGIELKAVAAVDILLYSEGEELQVRGPIHISLPLGHSTRLRASDTVPAWAFNVKTGAWENQGLGIVKAEGNELVWTYTASHLGYWIAAPIPSSHGYLWHGSSFDFTSYHAYLMMGIMGASLALVIGCLSLLLCHCG
ncbi:Protein FAM171B, partial [Dissostichus eleginoides]